MIEGYYNAFLPPSVRICGRWLETFTVWHRFLLEAIRSPFATGEGDITPADLLRAVKICRTNYDGSRSLKPGIRDFIWKRRMERNPHLFHRETGNFSKWLSLNNSRPDYWQKPSSSSGGESFTLEETPVPLALICSLMRRAGMSRSEAWGTPLGEALWLDAMLAKITGADLHFLPDDMPKDPADFTDEEAWELFVRDFGDTDKAREVFRNWQNNVKRRPAC